MLLIFKQITDHEPTLLMKTTAITSQYRPHSLSVLCVLCGGIDTSLSQNIYSLKTTSPLSKQFLAINISGKNLLAEGGHTILTSKVDSTAEKKVCSGSVGPVPTTLRAGIVSVGRGRAHLDQFTGQTGGEAVPPGL